MATVRGNAEERLTAGFSDRLNREERKLNLPVVWGPMRPMDPAEVQAAERFPVGSRVSIEGKHAGRVCALPVMFTPPDTSRWYPDPPAPPAEQRVGVMVALDRGFYGEDKKTFVMVLVVHPSNLTRID